MKCSSASASFPGGFPLSFGVILIVMWRSSCCMLRGRIVPAARGRLRPAAANCAVKRMPATAQRRRGVQPAAGRRCYRAWQSPAGDVGGDEAPRMTTAVACRAERCKDHLRDRQRLGVRDGQRATTAPPIAAKRRAAPPWNCSCGGPPWRTTSTSRHSTPRECRCRAPSSPLPWRRTGRRNGSPDRGGACSTRSRRR